MLLFFLNQFYILLNYFEKSKMSTLILTLKMSGFYMSFQIQTQNIGYPSLDFTFHILDSK